MAGIKRGNGLRAKKGRKKKGWARGQKVRQDKDRAGRWKELIRFCLLGGNGLDI